MGNMNFLGVKYFKTNLKLIFKMLKLVFKIPKLHISSCTSFARTWMGKTQKLPDYVDSELTKLIPPNSANLDLAVYPIWLTQSNITPNFFNCR